MPAVSITQRDRNGRSMNAAGAAQATATAQATVGKLPGARPATRGPEAGREAGTRGGGRATVDRSRGAARRVPERSADFDHLTLAALRDYRRKLTAEEGKVSYWRRIVQGRLDLVRSAGTASQSRASDSLRNLRDVLSDPRVANGRTSLLDVLPTDDIPPLPDLGPLWTREPGDDPAANEALADALDGAERQLSDYRSALHDRLGAATTELIARYREEPTLCLVALPRDPRARGRAVPV